jgi:hypothetical protein
MSSPSDDGSEYVYKYSRKYPEGVRIRKATRQDYEGMQAAKALSTAGAMKNLFSNKCKPLSESEQMSLDSMKALTLAKPLMTTTPEGSQDPNQPNENPTSPEPATNPTA